MTTQCAMQSNLRNTQRGFTLIELIMVIVILGILAAVAVPKFMDVSNDAKLSSAKGIFGEIATACANHGALHAMNSTTYPTATLTNIFANPGVIPSGVPTGWTYEPADGTLTNDLVDTYVITIALDAPSNGCVATKAGF
jgi:MSHA pilin protein MshA